MSLPTKAPTTVNGFSNAVADYLEEYGHNQNGRYYGEFLDGKGHRSACVRGAADEIDRGVDCEGDIEGAFLSALVRRVGDSIPNWSDHTSTPEVIATLRGLT